MLQRLPNNSSGLTYRKPQAGDGPTVWAMIAASGSLDENSIYCNLLQCTHFAETSVLVELGDQQLGWMSAYIPPDSPDTLFVWQICITPEARGRGIAQRMINAVLARPVCQNIRHVECTITESNDASWSMFRGLAAKLDAEFTSAPHFERERHFDGRHDCEMRVTIGPFQQTGAIS